MKGEGRKQDGGDNRHGVDDGINGFPQALVHAHEHARPQGQNSTQKQAGNKKPHRGGEVHRHGIGMEHKGLPDALGRREEHRIEDACMGDTPITGANPNDQQRRYPVLLRKRDYVVHTVPFAFLLLGQLSAPNH